MLSSTYYRNEIYSCNSEIESLDAEIRQLQIDIAELEELQGKFSTLHSDFIDEYNNRKTKVSDIGNLENVKFAATYYSGMHSLITGPEYYKANNGIVTAQVTINKKIKYLESVLDEKQTQRNNLNIWRNKLYYLLDEAVSEEANLY